MKTKNLILVNQLPISNGISAALTKSIGSYSASGIDIEIISLENDVATVIIKQSRLINGYILNQKQLVERCKEVFEPTGLKTKVLPAVFSIDVDHITVDWIKEKMIEFGIKRNDLIGQLALDKSYVSLLFADESNKRKINLSKPMKATFFYYFLTYELNRDFRNQ